MKYVFTKNTELPLNLSIKLSQYLIKEISACIILVIYLEINLLEKFNLSLRYILTKFLDLNNPEKALYKVFFIKLIDILRSKNFVMKENGNKL